MCSLFLKDKSLSAAVLRKFSLELESEEAAGDLWKLEEEQFMSIRFFVNSAESGQRHTFQLVGGLPVTIISAHWPFRPNQLPTPPFTALFHCCLGSTRFLISVYFCKVKLVGKRIFLLKIVYLFTIFNTFNLHCTSQGIARFSFGSSVLISRCRYTQFWMEFKVWII